MAWDVALLAPVLTSLQPLRPIPIPLPINAENNNTIQNVPFFMENRLSYRYKPWFGELGR